MNKKINVLSNFDGMSCGRIALDKIGANIGLYYAAEIDKHAVKVSSHNWPENINMGDVTKWRDWDIDWSSIDLFIGGSPCQGFSSAGKQGGTKAMVNGEIAVISTREQYENAKQKNAEFLSCSHLFWEFVLCLDHVKSCNPDVKFMLENVKMSKPNMKLVTDALGVEPVFINSSLVSAQNRQRYYWSNWEITQPEDKGVSWSDVREHGLNEYYYTEKGLQWLARNSQRKNKTLDVWVGNEKAQMIEASHFKNYSSQRFFGICDLPKDKSVVASMRGRRINLKTQKREDSNLDIKPKQYIEFRYDEKSNCLSTIRKDNIAVPFTLPNRVPVDDFFFRYISVVECCRLQNVPDSYFDGLASKTQSYKMLGNGWTVDVIAHIFNCMFDNK